MYSDQYSTNDERNHSRSTSSGPVDRCLSLSLSPASASAEEMSIAKKTRITQISC